MTDEELIDDRYCRFLIKARNAGGEKYQCRRPPTETGYCRHHTKCREERGKSLKTVYAMPIRPYVEGAMLPKEKKVLRYDESGVVGMNRMRVGWETQREMLFKTRLGAMQWKRSQLKVELVKLRSEYAEAAADFQRERLQRQINLFTDAVLMLDREIEREMEQVVAEVAA